jgi:hypothetical protein
VAIDRKYGRVTLETSTIEEDEPVVVFRAKDELLITTLHLYYVLCKDKGSPVNHLALIGETIEDIKKWQHDHDTQTPVSAGYSPQVGA